MTEESQKFPVKFPVLREFEDQRRYAGDDRFEIVSCPPAMTKRRMAADEIRSGVIR
jgi:hypothetical protein